MGQTSQMDSIGWILTQPVYQTGPSCQPKYDMNPLSINP